jgi:putative transposase
VPPSGGSVCALTGVSRASYYRDWGRAAPAKEETALRNLVQRLSLENRRYGYRRITALARREGWPVNHKIARIRSEDNLLALRKPAFRPATTDSRHGHVRWPHLARGLVSARPAYPAPELHAAIEQRARDLGYNTELLRHTDQ